MKRLLVFAALSLLAAGTACDQRELGTCDITQRACQESVYYRLLNLRSDGYDPYAGLPPVSVITEDEFRTMLEREQASQTANGPDPWNKALELLHFLPPTPDGGTASVDDEVTHVYAFYDPKTKAVTVISHPTQTGAQVQEEAMITLAHEFVHALQDRELNLQREDFETSDEYLANNGIIEGDARFYEDLFTEDVRRMLGYSARDPLLMPDQELDYVYTHFDEVGSPLFAARYLLYPLGAKYAATAYRSGGNAAVRHAYAKAPIRTVGFLVGPDGRVPPVGPGDVCPSMLTTSLPTKGADQLGALLFFTFLRGWGVAHEAAFATAQTWSGDYFRVQSTADVSTTAAAWRIEFSAAVPAGIATALSASGELSVTSDTRSLEITATDSTSQLNWQASNCQ